MNGIAERRERGHTRSDVRLQAFSYAPAVIAPSHSCGLVVDFLSRPLANIRDDQSTGAACTDIKVETPGIPHSEIPDFRQCDDWIAVPERIIRGDAIPEWIAVRDADVDSQHFA